MAGPGGCPLGGRPGRERDRGEKGGSSPSTSSDTRRLRPLTELPPRPRKATPEPGREPACRPACMCLPDAGTCLKDPVSPGVTDARALLSLQKRDAHWTLHVTLWFLRSERHARDHVDAATPSTPLHVSSPPVTPTGARQMGGRLAQRKYLNV